MSLTNRRDFLSLLGGVGVLAASDLNIKPASAEDRPDGGHKFYANGMVRPFAGNTIICHLPQQGPESTYFNALLDIYREAPKFGFTHKAAMLPPSSYHMTVFGGADDLGRGPGQWPEDVPRDLPIAECNRLMAERLKSFNLETALPIRMRIDTSDPAPDANTLKMRLLPLDSAENAKIRKLRSRLSDCLKIKSSSDYGFHSTLGYWVTNLSPSEQRECHDTLKSWQDRVAALCPVINLGAPEYCTFRDMFAFNRLFYLK
jgi:hypothetical protein